MQTFTTEKIITNLQRQVYSGDKSAFETIAPINAFAVNGAGAGAYTGDNFVTQLGIPNATGRLLLFGLMFNDDVNYVSSITFAGMVVNSFSDFGVPSAEYMPNKRIWWFYLYNPPTGNHDLVLSLTGVVNFAYNFGIYSGVDIAGGDPIYAESLDNQLTPTTQNITPPYTNSVLIGIYGAQTLTLGVSGQTVLQVVSATADNHRFGLVDSGVVYPDTAQRSVTFTQLGGAETGGSILATVATTLAGANLTCYLRPLNEEQSSVNGVQYGLGFMVIVECDVDIQQGDKLEIEGKIYTVRGVVNHDRGGYTKYKRAVVTLPEKQD